jgi:hypothetical protein
MYQTLGCVEANGDSIVTMQPSLDESAFLEQNGMYSFANMLSRFTELAGEPESDSYEYE